MKATSEEWGGPLRGADSFPVTQVGGGAQEAGALGSAWLVNNDSPSHLRAASLHEKDVLFLKKGIVDIESDDDYFKVLDIRLSPSVTWGGTRPREKTPPQAHLSGSSRARNASTEWVPELSNHPLNFPGSSRSHWLCAGGWELRMARGLALFLKRTGQAPCGIPRGLKLPRGLRHDRMEGRKEPDQLGAGEPPPRAGRQAAGAWPRGTLPPGGGQFSGPGVQGALLCVSEDSIVTGAQTPKKGPRISELWEEAGVGLWLLFARAGEGQSPRSSSGCFWGAGEGAQ